MMSNKALIMTIINKESNQLKWSEIKYIKHIESKHIQMDINKIPAIKYNRIKETKLFPAAAASISKINKNLGINLNNEDTIITASMINRINKLFFFSDIFPVHMNFYLRNQNPIATPMSNATPNDLKGFSAV